MMKLGLPSPSIVTLATSELVEEGPQWKSIAGSYHSQLHLEQKCLKFRPSDHESISAFVGYSWNPTQFILYRLPNLTTPNLHFLVVPFIHPCLLSFSESTRHPSLLIFLRRFPLFRPHELHTAYASFMHHLQEYFKKLVENKIKRLVLCKKFLKSIHSFEVIPICHELFEEPLYYYK